MSKQHNHLSDTARLAVTLVQRHSITPDDAGCQTLIKEQLKDVGFVGESMGFGKVSNLWLRRGTDAPLFVFAGHTDVVPTGCDKNWQYPPFEGVVVGQVLHGRGAADMKGSLAAMTTACQRFVRQYPRHHGSIALLLTSDEEGPAIDGTIRVIEELTRRGERINWCLVGEPTSKERLGDTIKNGRRGSLNGKLVVQGLQGHVAYPHLADNPIHHISRIATELSQQHWDNGNEHFPPTTFQVSNLSSGTGATNVIPADATMLFNFRFSPESSVDSLKTCVTDICHAHSTHFQIEWTLSGRPYQTDGGELTTAVGKAIESSTGHWPILSTDGGTSDGRFIAPAGAQVVELGPINRTIHRVDEHTDLDDLELLSSIYENVLVHLLT